MKLKKIISVGLAAVAACATIGLASCNDAKAGSNKAKIIDVALSSESYGVAVAKSNTELLNQINSVIETKATQIAAIISEYQELDENATKTVADAVTYNSSMANDDNYLVMATDAPFAPWEYNVGNGWGGIDIEIGNLIAQSMNKTLAVKQTSFETICLAVNNGDADIGLAGMTITRARQNTVNFSTPYYTDAYQVIVVKENDTTFDGCTTAVEIEAKLASLKNGTKVGSQTGTTGTKYITGDKNDPDGFGFDGFSNLKMKPYDTHADAVRDMLNGQVSLCIVDNAVAAQIVAQINAAA